MFSTKTKIMGGYFLFWFTSLNSIWIYYINYKMTMHQPVLIFSINIIFFISIMLYFCYNVNYKYNLWLLSHLLLLLLLLLFVVKEDVLIITDNTLLICCYILFISVSKNVDFIAVDYNFLVVVIVNHHNHWFKTYCMDH